MTDQWTRRGVLGAAGGAGLASLAGCTGILGGGADGSGGRTTGEGELPTADRSLAVAYDLGTLDRKTVSGGPSKDGIPSIDVPEFVDAGAADGFLTDRSVVFGVVRNGVTKAYPQHVLVHHEIVNDVLGDEPVSVTYCPLTGTAMGFLRGGTTFGVSGKLVNNNLVMYDRATDSRWPQLLGTAIRGPHRGDSLREFRVIWTTWGRWKRVHPNTHVLSEDTGYARNYDRDPYGSYTPPGGYYTTDRVLFQPLTVDDRYHLKRVVIGSRTADGTIVFLKSALRKAGVLEGTLAGNLLLAVHDPLLDTAHVYRNPDGDPFTPDRGRLRGPDGTRYPPSDLPLEPVYAFDGMWFAWVGFYPDLTVVT